MVDVHSYLSSSNIIQFHASPLRYAAKGGDVSIVECLIKSGADANAIDEVCYLCDSYLSS